MLAKHLGKMTFYCIVYKNPLKRNGLSGFVAVSPSEVPRIPAPRSLSCGARLNSLNSWSKTCESPPDSDLRNQLQQDGP